MKDLLSRLKKAVDRALDVHAATQEIALAEFPAYVVKSLETILADGDRDRAANRLAVLRTKVDEACALAKQSAGAAEDTDSQKITVTVFEEPGLSAKPKVESETSPAAAGAALGASAVAGPDGMLGKALDALRREVSEIKGMLGKDMHPGSEDDDEEKKRKAKDKDEDEDEDQAKAGDKDEDEESDKAKAGDDEEDEDKKQSVAKAQWPLDMNSTMPGAESVQKRHPDLEWGTDPDRQGASQAQG